MPATPRQALNINRDWRFQLGDYPGAEKETYNDASWSSVGLPHSFSIPYFGSKSFYTGYGWYRKHIDYQPVWAGKRVFLQFEAAFQDAEVFVNGQRIGEHKGGYTGFSMDITSALKPGASLLAVRLNNKWNPRLAPRAGEHTFSGGIYRDVSLVVTDPLHVAWYGTFVTTPQISAESAKVNIKTEVANDGSAPASCTLRQQVLDPDGDVVTEVKSTQTVASGTTVTFDQTTAAIPHPKLWHPKHPFLYSARTTIERDSRPVDAVLSPLGFRWMKWTADRGFFLNGEHYYFHGANVHQDHAGWGDAVTDGAIYRDVKMIKEAGFDFIRGSHYPHNPAFTDACDKLGVMFWSENCFWGVGGLGGEGYWNSSAYPPNPRDQPEFEQSVRDTLRDEIRIHRNHPSVVIWSMSNEPFFSASTVMDKVRAFLPGLVAESHALDPTRAAAIGGCQRGDIDKLGDVAGYNGDGARMFLNPGVPSVVSEYGSTISDRPGGYAPGWGALQKEEFPWRSGQAIWCGFDHGSIGGHFGFMGLIDYFRLPKRGWYWYRNEYTKVSPPEWPKAGTPATLKLKASNSQIMGTTGTDDCQIVCTVLNTKDEPVSNSPPVTFTIESGPGEFPTGRSIVFHPDSRDPESDIAIRDGQAAIEFRSYFGGTSIIRATSPGLHDGTIAITTLGDPQFVPGESPLTPDRPYIRFTKASTPITVGANIALNRPTLASREAAGHSAKLAVDGDLNTGWQPTNTSENPWWQVDLEGLNSVQSIDITFGSKGNYRYKIDGSGEGVTWVLLKDQTQTANTDQHRVETCANNQHIRYVRITLTGGVSNQPTLIEEVKIQGRQSP